MKINKLWLLIAVAAIGLVGYASIGFAAHPDVTLKDVDGAAISSGSSVPYSPKQTCGGCHIANCVQPSVDNPKGYCTTQQSVLSDYESDPVTIAKHQRFADGTEESYNVTAPKHGVTSGFHSHQGRSVTWGDTQRNYYKVPGFTSSPGMYGKY